MGVILVDPNKTYVTYWRLAKYGKFDPEHIETNFGFSVTCKPKRAFWGSPVDADYGWKDWCEDNEYEYDFSNPIYWRLKEGSKILTIDAPDVEDESNSIMNKYIIELHGSKSFDFAKMAEDGIDAVELMNACIGHCFINRIETMFNAWDCESIVLLNPSKLIIL